MKLGHILLIIALTLVIISCLDSLNYFQYKEIRNKHKEEKVIEEVKPELNILQLRKE